MLMHSLGPRILCIRRSLSCFPVIMANQGKKVVLKHLDGDETFTVSFTVANPTVRVNRQFNMSRNINEEMSPFLERLHANLEKAVSKKKKNKKVVEESPTPDYDTKVSFIKGGQIVEPGVAAKVKDFLFQSDLQIRIFEEDFEVKINPPMVDTIKLPESIMSGFMVYPYKINLHFANKLDSRFEWWVSEATFNEKPKQETKDWVKRGEGFFFIPTAQDINRLIKLVCTPRLGLTEGFPLEVVSKSLISAGPGNCPFEDRHMFTPTFLEGDEFRVLSYNLLADLYADSDYSRQTLHPQCPPYALAIDYRKQLIIKEVLGFHADIMCMQEVDLKIFEGDLLPVFSSEGYDGVHDLKGGKVSEGVAAFWRNSRFRSIDHRRLVVADAIENEERFAHIKRCITENELLKDDILKRTTAVQTVVLEDISSNGKRGFVVGNTHLYFRPDADHIRLVQIGVCLAQLESTLIDARNARPEMEFSLLLFGDMNSTPPFAVLELMRTRLIETDHPDWSSCPVQEVRGLRLEHPFNLDTACGTPEFTTYTIGFKDCLDYIFYQKDKLEVTSVVPFPLIEELEKQIGIPNVTFPSDHISCVADLKWKTSVKN